MTAIFMPLRARLRGVIGVFLMLTRRPPARRPLARRSLVKARPVRYNPAHLVIRLALARPPPPLPPPAD